MTFRQLLLPVLLTLYFCSLSAQPDRVYTSLDQVTDPQEVYILSLKKHRLKEFPSEILTYTNLRQLNLSHNRIRHIPDSIGCLTQLKVLNLSHNPILELPASIAQLTHLEELILNMTGIVALPPESKTLNYTLHLLDLRACPLTYDDQVSLEQLLPSPQKRWHHVCNCQ